MWRIIIISVAVFVIATVTTMVGRGGGNFYVPVLIAAGQPVHEAATSGQFILFFTAFAGMLIFQKHKAVDWKLALVIDMPTNVMAFVGGYLSGYISGVSLEFILAAMLVIAGCFMLVRARERSLSASKRFGFWQRRFGGEEYLVNLWLVIPITAAVGLVAGAVGISGGSFKIPLMVVACGVPMRVAVGTSSAMVAATALMGFLGHTAGGDFNPEWAIPVACVAVVGGLLGGKLALKTQAGRLKLFFTLTTFAAAAFVLFNALRS